MAIGSGVLLPGVAENPTFPILSALAYTTGSGYRPTCDVRTKFQVYVALPFPEKIGGTPKNLGRPGYAHAPFSVKFFTGLCSDEPCECISQICSP